MMGGINTTLTAQWMGLHGETEMHTFLQMPNG
jgi:hypothetical protein